MIGLGSSGLDWISMEVGLKSEGSGCPLDNSDSGDREPFGSNVEWSLNFADVQTSISFREDEHQYLIMELVPDKPIYYPFSVREASLLSFFRRSFGIFASIVHPQVQKSDI